MNPIAFKIGFMTIHWYGVMAAIGFTTALSMLYLYKRHAELTSEQVSDLALYGMIAGIIGGRLFYVIQFWKSFRNDPLEIIRLDHGGLVFYGGLICSLSVIYIYCRRKNFSVLKIFDIFAPALAAGHAFGRIGCFLQGCCYGKPAEFVWAVTFPAGSDPSFKYPQLNAVPVAFRDPATGIAALRYPSRTLHPVQLYEATFNVALAIFLIFCLKKLKKPGQTAGIYLVFYGLARFLFEFLRGDHTSRILNFLTVAQVIGVCVVLCGIFIFIRSGKVISKTGRQ